MPDRLTDTTRFYDLLDRLAQRVGGPRLLKDCHGRMNWPQRGVYFFYELGEDRSWSGSGPRVVRVGTHAITHPRRGSGTKLWTRLNQHKGVDMSAEANQRGSIFRKILGVPLAKKDSIPLPRSWNVGSSASAASQRLGMTREQVRREEAELGRHVSHYIRHMPFLWLNVDDPPGPNSQRAHIERSAIALLSGYGRATGDRPSSAWLGHLSDRERVRLSGLWNNNHVDEVYDPQFLDALQRRIETTSPL